MSLFNPHIEGKLPRLAEGGLSPQRFRSLLSHVKGCPRCANAYQVSIHALRQLENGSPFVPAQAELALIEAANLPRGGFGDQPARARFDPPFWLKLGAAAVAASLIAVVMWQRVSPLDADELTARGGSSQGAAAMRVFCGGAGQPLRELSAEQTCQPGQSLVLAVGARAPGQKVAVQFSGSASQTLEGIAGVQGTPGAEAALDFTVVLEREGTLEVVAAFAADGAMAARAAKGEAPDAAVTVLRRTVRVTR